MTAAKSRAARASRRAATARAARDAAIELVWSLVPRDCAAIMSNARAFDVLPTMIGRDSNYYATLGGRFR